MKTHLAEVVALYEGIRLDLAALWPTYASEGHDWMDLIHLRHAAEHRGLGFFTLTLPSLGKWLEAGLELGVADSTKIPQGIKVHEGMPVLYRYLFDQVFDTEFKLRTSPLVASAVADLRQLCYAVKRLRVDCKPQAVKDTLDEFFAIEEGMLPPHTDTWESTDPKWLPRKGHPLYGEPSRGYSESFDFLDSVNNGDLSWNDFRGLCRRVVSQLGTPDWWSIEPKHGPGVVSEPKRDFVSKYEFPNWPEKLERVFPFDWFGSGLIGELDRPADRELPSRLIAVPKSAKGPRLICAEPLSHQWIQQGIWRWLEERVYATVLGRSINFRDQRLSQVAAANASIDGSSCTVDLSSASDRLSCRLVEYVFQGSEILDGMHAARTRCLMQTISEDHPKMIVLKKFAPMGSALTFPVQTIVYTLLTVHALRMAEGRIGNWTDWEADFDRVRVFGDDIIAPNHAYSAIRTLFESVGLKVNDHKSFTLGKFRESCGMDAYNGVDVTPAYLLESYSGSASSMSTTIEASNNFHKKGYWNAAKVIANFIPPKERKLLRVIGVEDGGLGLQSFTGGTVDHLASRWNKDYQRIEYIALGIDTKVDRKQGTGFSGLTQYWVERPRPDVNWASGQSWVVRTRKVRTRVTL
nr:MAG: hypothetical protein 3 [Leviviridae sp.]